MKLNPNKILSCFDDCLVLYKEPRLRPEKGANLIGNAAVWTMVRNEDYFLKLWVSYYEQFVPREHIFIVVDGLDSTLPDGLDGCQILTFPRSEVGEGWDKKRWEFLSSLATMLTRRFEVVVGGDVDELVVLDPQYGNDPINHVLTRTTTNVISPFAIEIIHRVDLEQPLSIEHPVLSQRRYGRINFTYCKPCITRVPINWSIGQHYADYPELTLSDELFLFHLRFLDRDMLIQRQKSRNEIVSDPRGSTVSGVAGYGWQKSYETMENFLISFVQKGPPEETDFRFEWQRRRLKKNWYFDEEKGFWFHDPLHNRRTYTLPERFCRLF